MITADTLAALAELFRGERSFHMRLDDIQWFGDRVAYGVPQPGSWSVVARIALGRSVDR